MALTLQQLKSYRLPIIDQPLTRVTTVNELPTTNLFEALGSALSNYEALNPNGSIATTSATSSLWSTGGTSEVDIHTSMFITGGYYDPMGVLISGYGHSALVAGNPAIDGQFAQLHVDGVNQVLKLSSTTPSDEGIGVFLNINSTGIFISDTQNVKQGLSYYDDYSADLVNSPRSIPDVGTVNQLISASGSPYTSYVARLSQGGTDAPNETVYVNELNDNIVWTYISTGVYEGTLADGFVATNFWATSSALAADGTTLLKSSIKRTASDTIRLVVESNDISQVFIEIRMYS